MSAVDIDHWLKLYSSENPTVRLRAARAIIARNDAPLPTLLEILDTHHYDGLGAATERALLKRVKEPDIYNAMISRLTHKASFVREVACKILGRVADHRAGPHLLEKLDDPAVMVRRSAGFAFAYLGDCSVLEELRRQLEAKKTDDSNVTAALKCAIQNLEAKKMGLT